MSRALRAAATASLALLLAGCAVHYDTSRLGVPVTMAGPAGQAVVGDTFAVSRKSVHVLWGMVGVKSPDLQKALASQLSGAEGVANLSIRSRARWSDVLVTVLTLGVVNPRTVTYEGVVVRPKQ